MRSKGGRGQREINQRTYRHRCITHGHKQKGSEGLGQDWNPVDVGNGGKGGYL